MFKTISMSVASPDGTPNEQKSQTSVQCNGIDLLQNNNIATNNSGLLQDDKNNRSNNNVGNKRRFDRDLKERVNKRLKVELENCSDSEGKIDEVQILKILLLMIKV